MHLPHFATFSYLFIFNIHNIHRYKHPMRIFIQSRVGDFSSPSPGPFFPKVAGLENWNMATCAKEKLLHPKLSNELKLSWSQSNQWILRSRFASFFLWKKHIRCVLFWTKGGKVKHNPRSFFEVEEKLEQQVRFMKTYIDLLLLLYRLLMNDDIGWFIHSYFSGSMFKSIGLFF